MFSKEYLDWVKESNLKNLTNTQHKFAEFLLKNHTEIGKIGNLEDIFTSVRKYVKDNHDKFQS